MSARDATPVPDLGALLGRLLDIVVEREAPILDAHGVTMWEYVILGRLAAEDGLTQKELARRSRRDPTRLIGHLDELGSRGLVAREIDPIDRRRRTVRLTDEGRRLADRVRDRIDEMEDELLDGHSRDIRRALVAALDRAHE